MSDLPSIESYFCLQPFSHRLSICFACKQIPDHLHQALVSLLIPINLHNLILSIDRK